MELTLLECKTVSKKIKLPSFIQKIYELIAGILGLLFFTFIILRFVVPNPFKPKYVKIKYVEEVKLYNDKSLWIKVKRHYYLKKGSGALGDSGCLDIEYIGDGVEVGVKGKAGLGRRSIYFDDLSIVSNIGELWFFLGQCKSGKSYKPCVDLLDCRSVGYPVGNHEYLVVINTKGEPVEMSQVQLIYFYKHNPINILHPNAVKECKSLMTRLSRKKLTWRKKINLENKLPSWQRNIGQRLFKNGGLDVE